MGILFVTTILFLIPEVGARIVSAIIDHFGLLSVPLSGFGAGRAIGLALLLAGLFLIERS